MIKNCLVCGKETTSSRVFCEDCLDRLFELFKALPSDLKDALSSVDLVDAAWDIYQKYGVQDFSDAIAGYIGLIAVDVKSKADLRGFLVKEAKLKPDEAKALANEIVNLYFE